MQPTTLLSRCWTYFLSDSFSLDLFQNCESFPSFIVEALKGISDVFLHDKDRGVFGI